MNESPALGERVEISDLVIKSGVTRLLQGMSLRIPAGQVTALVGPSGAGKSLTAQACLGLLSMRPGVCEGSVRVVADGQDLQVYGHQPRGLQHRNFRKIRGQLIGLLPQDPVSALDPMLRVHRQVQGVLQLTGEPSRPSDVFTALRRAGFDDPAYASKRYPHELSGGMAQRVCIAQALARRSRFLIADEPVTGLDPEIAGNILAALNRLSQEGTGVLLITHDLRAVRDHADRVLVIHRGRVIEELRPEQLEAGRHPVTQSLVEATAKVAGDWS